jgi:hypothetical protein
MQLRATVSPSPLHSTWQSSLRWSGGCRAATAAEQRVRRCVGDRCVHCRTSSEAQLQAVDTRAKRPNCEGVGKGAAQRARGEKRRKSAVHRESVANRTSLCPRPLHCTALAERHTSAAIEFMSFALPGQRLGRGGTAAGRSAEKGACGRRENGPTQFDWEMRAKLMTFHLTIAHAEMNIGSSNRCSKY